MIPPEDYAIGAYDSLNDRILIASPIRDAENPSSESSCPSQGIRSRIIAEAGEDFSLLQIAGIAKPGDDSITASVAEKTDKIINQLGYSGVLNSTDEMIEAAVNASGTLGMLAANNSKSLNGSKDSQQPRVNNSYSNDVNSSFGGRQGHPAGR